jgi:hypothetical protein
LAFFIDINDNKIIKLKEQFKLNQIIFLPLLILAIKHLNTHTHINTHTNQIVFKFSKEKERKMLRREKTTCVSKKRTKSEKKTENNF